MKIEIDEFVLENVFNKHEYGEDGVLYWVPSNGGGEGYIVLWPEGDYLHTYRYPPDTDWEA